MSGKQCVLYAMVVCSIAPVLIWATNSATSSSKGNEQTQVILVANNTIGAGGTFTVSGGDQEGTTGAVSSQASAEQKFTADIPVGPGGDLGAMGAGMGTGAEFGGAALGGYLGSLQQDEGRGSGGAYYSPRRSRTSSLETMDIGGGSSTKEGDDPFSGTLTDIDVSAKATQGSIQVINASSVTFEKVEFNKLMQLTLPDYSAADIKKILAAKQARLVKGYEVRPTEGKSFDMYKQQGKELVIKILISIQKARPVTLASLQEAGKEVKPVNGKQILEIIVYRQTPGEAKKSQWTELMSIVQNAYDSRPGALFKIDQKGWLSVYISKVGIATTLADSGVTEKLPFTVPVNFTYTSLKDNEWKNQVSASTLSGYAVAGYQFGKEKILLVNKGKALEVYRKLTNDWKKVATRVIENPLSKPGYYIQIQNAANNGFLDLYDTNDPAFIFKLAMKELFGKNLKKID